jgi:hypothetical protein
MVLDDGINRRKSQSSSGFLCGEERIKDFVNVLLGNALALICDLDLNTGVHCCIRIGSKVGMLKNC